MEVSEVRHLHWLLPGSWSFQLWTTHVCLHLAKIVTKVAGSLDCGTGDRSKSWFCPRICCVHSTCQRVRRKFISSQVTLWDWMIDGFQRTTRQVQTHSTRVHRSQGVICGGVDPILWLLKSWFHLDFGATIPPQCMIFQTSSCVSVWRSLEQQSSEVGTIRTETTQPLPARTELRLALEAIMVGFGTSSAGHNFPTCRLVYDLHNNRKNKERHWKEQDKQQEQAEQQEQKRSGPNFPVLQRSESPEPGRENVLWIVCRVRLC